MFLFNSLHQGNPKVSRSLRASGSSGHLHGKRSDVFAMFILFCLPATLLLTGCKTEENNDDDHKLNSQLVGTWTSEYGDLYSITSTYLSYGYGGDSISYAGIIKYVSNFTNDAGVIVIEYDDDHKASYWEYDDNWDPTEELPLKGNFIGIYYKEFKPGVSVKMGGAYVYGGAEEATLDAAIKAFTLGNEGTYIYGYGTYSK
jgi:hypothetical protein